MTNNIPGIGINTSGVNSYTGQPSSGGKKPDENVPETKPAESTNVQVSPNDVLAMMAQQAVLTAPNVSQPKTYDVGKYNSPEQIARIGELMAAFEGDVAKALLAIEAEFGDLLSDEAKHELAANMV